jgi:hypothetical protein
MITNVRIDVSLVRAEPLPTLAAEPSRTNDQENPRFVSDGEAHAEAVENIDHAAAMEPIPKLAGCAEDRVGPSSPLETFAQPDENDQSASDQPEPRSAVDENASANDIHGEQSLSNPHPRDGDLDRSPDAVDGNPTSIDTIIVGETANLTKDDRVSNDVNGNALKQIESSSTYRDTSETDVESDPWKLLKCLLRQLDKKET